MKIRIIHLATTVPHYLFNLVIFLQNWRRWPHFPTKLAAGRGGLIFLQNWWRRQGFGNTTGGLSDMVWILVFNRDVPIHRYRHRLVFFISVSVSVWWKLNRYNQAGKIQSSGDVCLSKFLRRFCKFQNLRWQYYFQHGGFALK